MKKRFFSLLIAPILLGCISTPAFASNTKANLYDMYSDNMLFQQNAISKISGTATSGSKIEIEIYNSKNEKILSSSTKAKNNSFSVEFLAPKGSFESYSITIKENGKEFRTLKNVVFGELWIASGQSNMHYPLGQEKTIRTLEDLSAFKASPYIRSMIMPTYDATIDGKSYYETLPYAPQKDVKGASWITGDSENVAGMSAVGYFFANKMLDDLNVPIGIINAPLGGTPIATWLSREAIDENEKIKNTLTETGFYIDKSSWGATQDIYRDLTL
ncbi:MAG: sialate O-acetylesterase, partial [Ruminococcaceae bacterium]|nr:sialate O-acetylesterase [Oscillospiraceae bacterium]